MSLLRSVHPSLAKTLDEADLERSLTVLQELIGEKCQRFPKYDLIGRCGRIIADGGVLTPEERSMLEALNLELEHEFDVRCFGPRPSSNSSQEKDNPSPR